MTLKIKDETVKKLDNLLCKPLTVKETATQPATWTCVSSTNMVHTELLLFFNEVIIKFTAVTLHDKKCFGKELLL